MNAGPCTTPRPGLSLSAATENAPTSGPPHRNRGFFMPGVCPDSGGQLASIGRLTGCAFRKAARCTCWQFSDPADRPAPKPGFTSPDWS